MQSPVDPSWESVTHPPPLIEGVLHVWHARLERLPCRPEWLAEDEHRRWERSTHPAMRKNFCANRTLLRRLLSDYLDKPPGAVTIRLSEQGRPCLPDASLDFNLSHSGGHLLLAFGRGLRVGIDCENPRPVRQIERLAQRLFPPDELAEWQAAGSPPGDFFTLWTRMEACQKCLGEGLFGQRLPPEAVDFRHLLVEGAPGCVAWSPPRPVKLRFLRLAPL